MKMVCGLYNLKCLLSWEPIKLKWSSLCYWASWFKETVLKVVKWCLVSHSNTLQISSLWPSHHECVENIVQEVFRILIILQKNCLKANKFYDSSWFSCTEDKNLSCFVLKFEQSLMRVLVDS